MRIATQNLNWGGEPGAPGCDGEPRLERLVSCIAKLDADLLVLTEFKQGTLGDELGMRLAGVGYSNLLTCPQGRYDLGVAIASRHALTSIDMPVPAPAQPWRLVGVRTAGIAVIGLYFPLKEAKLLFWDWLLTYSQQLRHQEVVLAGDFNTGKALVDEAGDTFDCQDKMKALEELGFVDTWRAAYPHGRDYTWYSAAGNGFRLDHIWASASLAPKVSRVLHEHEPRLRRATDHSAVVVDIDTLGATQKKVLGNIFKLGECPIPEDRFSAAWALTLSRDAALAQAVANTLLAPTGRTSRVTTVADHPLCNSPKRPDFRIECEDLDILVEHKLDASLHENQLEDYLAIEADKPTYVAFIAPASQVVPAPVLAHPNYLRPEGKRHFRWSDLYSAVRSRPDWLAQELADHMDGLGMAPYTLKGWEDIFDEGLARTEQFAEILKAATSEVFVKGNPDCWVKSAPRGRGCEVRLPHPNITLVYLSAAQRPSWASGITGPVLEVEVYERDLTASVPNGPGAQDNLVNVSRHELTEPMVVGQGTCRVVYAASLSEVMQDTPEATVERIVSLLRVVRRAFWDVQEVHGG